MYADGSIIIDTSLDLDGITKSMEKFKQVLASGAQNSAKSFAAVDQALSLLESKLDNTNAQIVVQQKLLDELRGKYERALSIKGPDDPAVLKLQKQVLSAENSVINLTQKSDKLAAELRELDNEARDAAKGTEELAKETKNAGDKIQDTSGKVSAMTIAMGNLIADAIRKVISALKDFSVQGTEYASDLREVQNVVDSTFGARNAQKISDWAKTTKEAFGISELQAKEYTGTVGAMLKAMGLTERQVLDMSKSITGLSGDLASFKNVKPEEALAKLRAGLSGESEPLKAWGILINESTVKTYAYKNGIARTGQELTEQQKVLARYGLIMKQTADAQGDFSKTSGEFANQQRLASENLKEASGVLGEKLLPVLTEGLMAFNKFISENRPVLEQWGGVIAIVVDTLLKAIMVLASVPAPVYAIIGTIVGVVAAFLSMYQTVSKMSAVFDPANTAMLKTTAIILGVIAALIILALAIAAITGKSNDFERSMSSVGDNIGKLKGQVNTASSPRGYARGTLSAPPGLAWVGEDGPELVDFRGGERVYTATQSRAMASSNTTTQNAVQNFYVTIPAKDVQEFNGVVKVFRDLSRTANAGRVAD